MLNMHEVMEKTIRLNRELQALNYDPAIYDKYSDLVLNAERCILRGESIPADIRFRIKALSFCKRTFGIM